MNRRNQERARDLDRRAASQNFAKIAKVTSVNVGGLYDVELTGGQALNNVNSIAGYKLYEGQWVTLEYFGGDWTIAGNSAQRGGD